MWSPQYLTKGMSTFRNIPRNGESFHRRHVIEGDISVPEDLELNHDSKNWDTIRGSDSGLTYLASDLLDSRDTFPGHLDDLC